MNLSIIYIFNIVCLLVPVVYSVQKQTDDSELQFSDYSELRLTTPIPTWKPDRDSYGMYFIFNKTEMAFSLQGCTKNDRMNNIFLDSANFEK